MSRTIFALIAVLNMTFALPQACASVGVRDGTPIKVSDNLTVKPHQITISSSNQDDDVKSVTCKVSGTADGQGSVAYFTPKLNLPCSGQGFAQKDASGHCVGSYEARKS